MSANSPIEWTGRTWNPIGAFLKSEVKIGERIFRAGTRGWFCVKVSPGCANCYAEGINLRLGNGLHYVRVNLDQIEWRFIGLTDPLRWKKPQTVFVDSMSDLFFEQIPEAMIDSVFGVMALCPTHTFQVLTKRAKRLNEYFQMIPGMQTPCGRIFDAAHAIRKQVYVGRSAPYNLWTNHIVCMPIPLPNVWLGVSVEDQIRADERILPLLRTPAAIRFLSCEPLLGRISLSATYNVIEDSRLSVFNVLGGGTNVIDWVIVGGESGARARHCDIRWIEDLVAQCRASNVPVFVKQLGSRPVAPGEPISLRDRKGGDPSEWPNELRVREFPKPSVSVASVVR